MTTYTLRPWSQAVHLHPDVERGDTAVATYAIDLGALVDGDPQIPQVYRQARDFFSVTHLTEGLRRLLQDVLGGLTGGTGDRVLQLRSPFGGGKSHTLAALYHAANDPSALNVLPEASALPNPGPVRVAVFDGEKFDVRGRQINGQRVQTMWGALAARLGCYEIVEYHDRNRIAPGGDVIAAMLSGGTSLLLLDEVLKYIERVLAEQVGDSTLGRQTQDFLQSLSTEVARAPHAVLVYSLQASAGEAYGNESLLRMIDHLTSRVDAKREPVAGDEILPVLRRRLLAEPPETAAASAAADAFATEITRMRAAHAVDDLTRRSAEDDRVALRNRIEAAYPFHPALIDIMTERWASLPDFQRTRGALRFLAVCLHGVKAGDRAGTLLGPGDIPIDNSDVLQAFFTEVGQREPFKAVLERDFKGANARVPRIDAQLAYEHPGLATVRPAMRLATAILMYSFGGLQRPGDPGGEGMATGVGESELLAGVVGPDLDSLTAQAVLRQLREQCLFLHYDGTRYVFKTTPNVTQVLEDEANHVRPEEIEQAIEDELSRRLAGRGAILWRRHSQDIPDLEARFLLAYLPLDFAQQGDAAQEQQALDLLTQHGDRPRRYRNGLGLAIPERAQVEPIRRAVRYLKAIERVRGKRQQLNLTQAQMEQLKQREERTEKPAFESAIRNVYQSVWLPVVGNQGAVSIEKVTLAGRPLQAQDVHQRLIELLTVVSPPRLFGTVTPEKIIELLRLGGQPGAPLSVTAVQVVESFFAVLGFPRLENDSVLRRAIAAGVQSGAFGYVGRSSLVDAGRLREAGDYQVDAGLVRIRIAMNADDIDLTGALIVLPNAILAPAPGSGPTNTGAAGGAQREQGSTAQTPLGGNAGQTGNGPTYSTGTQAVQPTTPQTTALSTTVRWSMRLTRRQLYAATNALANLADAAGGIQVIIEATRSSGFDPAWLRNAVLEPLEEADIEVE